jgi:hypothetical protein
MSEGRIPDIMSDTGSLHETRNDLNLIGSDDTEFVREPCSNFDAKRPPDGCDLKTVDQTVMDVIVVVKWMDLGLVRQPTERLRKQDAVNVLSVRWTMLLLDISWIVQPLKI